MSRSSRRGSAAATAAHISASTIIVSSGADDTVATQLARTEKVVRIEAERREAKARMYLYDNMIALVKDQLLCVSQLKEQWVAYKSRQEEERQAVMTAEREQRARLQTNYVASLNELCQQWAHE